MFRRGFCVFSFFSARDASRMRRRFESRDVARHDAVDDGDDADDAQGGAHATALERDGDERFTRGVVHGDVLPRYANTYLSDGAWGRCGKVMGD